MIKIELTTGEVLENDPQYGMNLDNAAEITVCLETGDYRWTGIGGRFEVLGAADVKRVYGEEAPSDETPRSIRYPPGTG